MHETITTNILITNSDFIFISISICVTDESRRKYIKKILTTGGLRAVFFIDF